jgi:hypothetical protein
VDAQALTDTARLLALPERTLRAFITVESSGAGTTPAGPVIRVEVHKFWLFSSPSLYPKIDARFRVKGPKPWEGHEWRPFATEGEWWPMHQPGDRGQRNEHVALEVAKSIDPDAAVRATSYGLGQVLGDNWRRLGFTSVDEFERMQASEYGQVVTMGRFIAADATLLKALRGLDFATAARRYNGGGQVDEYARRLADAYRRAA